MGPQMLFRWLGVAGLEVTYGDQVLLVDPYVSRISFRKQWLGPVRPLQRLVKEKLPRAHFILVTHAHYDHMLDVAEVMANTGALALGSHNTCTLLFLLGRSAGQIREVKAGDSVDLGKYQVKVLPALHGWAPGFGPGALRTNLKPPLGARDYRFDACYSYLIEVDGIRLLVSAGEFQDQVQPAQVLFANPTYSYTQDLKFLRQVQPEVIIPIHWDDFWRRLDQPIRPMFQPPKWSWPPLQRVDLVQFQRGVNRIAPNVRVFVPERFKEYNLRNL
jgi:L-ascorbate metabolism protein UlaG (beta-lactamase superfamily)